MTLRNAPGARGPVCLRSEICCDRLNSVAGIDSYAIGGSSEIHGIQSCYLVKVHLFVYSRLCLIRRGIMGQSAKSRDRRGTIFRSAEVRERRGARHYEAREGGGGCIIKSGHTPV